MPSFEDMFMKSRGKPIEYKGRTIIMVDHFPVQSAQRLQLTLEQCNGEWRQGVSLRIRDGGEMVVNDQRMKQCILWYDSAPHVIEIAIAGDVPALEIKNIWDTGDGVVHSWHHGAAMIVQSLPNGRRYFCNDGLPDENFDDIVFLFERLSGVPMTG
jgi:hypothetical protein